MRTRPDHLLAQARERFAMQDYRGAIMCLEEVVESGRSFADVHHLLGLCWSLLGQSDRALSAFDRALELNNRYIEAHIHRGLVLNQLGRVVEADAAFTRAALGGRRGADGLPAAVAGELANQHAALGEAYASMNPFSTAKYEGVYGAINWTPTPLWAKFFFQLVFAGTAATIVSGAVAERIKFGAFLLFSFILVAVVYPISGHWIWGGGFLGSNNFRDFAGSTVVHSVGGWAALAGVIVLGPRLGKYRDGRVHPIPGHNMTSAALGVLILWLGWFGFNPGSTMAAMDGKAISHILVNTNIAAAAASLSALVTAWVLLKKPDMSMVLNGCLAGLVAITAPCAFVTITSGAIIGLIAGILVVLAVVFFDKLKLDDPVGALAVHLCNGVFGTLALGLFYDNQVATDVAALATGLSRGAQTWVQLKGILAVGAFVFPFSLVIWFILKATMGIRVGAEEETEGLDIGEHGNEAYPDFTAAHK